MSFIKDKLTSRKLWAFVAATVLLLLHAISAEVWSMVALAYLGSQGAVDAAQHLAGALANRNLGGVIQAISDGVSQLVQAAPATVPSDASRAVPVLVTEAPPLPPPPPPPVAVWNPETRKYELPA